MEGMLTLVRDSFGSEAGPSANRVTQKTARPRAQSEKACVRPPLTLLVLQLPQDNVQGAHLGFEWLHQLGTDDDLVLVRSTLSRQGYSGLGHVVDAQPGSQRKFLSIDTTATKLESFGEANKSKGRSSALL